MKRAIQIFVSEFNMAAKSNYGNPYEYKSCSFGVIFKIKTINIPPERFGCA